MAYTVTPTGNNSFEVTDSLDTVRETAKVDAGLASQLKSVTPEQAVIYIENNVTDLASAKAVLKIMVRMLIAMRNNIWADGLD